MPVIDKRCFAKNGAIKGSPSIPTAPVPAEDLGDWKKPVLEKRSLAEVQAFGEFGGDFSAEIS